MTTIATLADKVNRAQQQLANAQAKQADAEAADRAALAARQADYDQRILDDYDPAALRRAVVDTYDACLTAGDADLTAAVRAHLRAVIDEYDHARAALEAHGLGAAARPEILSPRTGQLRAPDQYADHAGHAITTTRGDALTEYAAKVQAAALAESVRGEAKQARAERDAHRAAFIAGDTDA